MHYCILVILAGCIGAQNFRYIPDDWYILTKPGSITAITEDNFDLYFATENGVYRYNKSREDFQYDYIFSVQLEFPNITHFYFDSYRDYFWVVHEQGISFKSSVSTIWRDMSLINSGIFSIYEIGDIGSSPEYFWIRSADDVYPFDPFSAEPADWADANEEEDFIQWGHSRTGITERKIDISRYSIEGDWTVGLHKISHRDGREMEVTVFMEDDEGNQWFGTDAGYILKGWRHSFRLELINIGLPFDHVTVAYSDKEGNWWFADSRFKRTGQLSTFNGLYQTENSPFISQWNEPDNQWTYYMPDESIVISNTDVNAILNIGSTMYFGTMYGLLYLDLYNRDWNLIDASNGLNDSAVWDMVEYDGSIFLATANGVNEISIINHTVIPDRINRFENISHFNIYDMEADSQYLYLASDAGLLQLNWDGGEIKTLSKKEIRKIRLEESGIVGTDGTLWSINEMDDEKYITSNVQDFDICGSYVWSSQGNQVTLLDTITAQSWEYNREDGIPGNKIYDVNCDDDWVWFLTNKGVAFYNWSRYHNKEN